ncbi:MAG TPA: LacI family DNA-binding transcriptional regulator [Propionibacteriaceae bacterium]|nr:LacI family DNA-binding transcriptional regulator [Propionibacteriaceae bacterium]
MTMQTERSITIEDVALAAGVSRAAVSKVIRDAYGVSPQMRTKVEAAIEKLDYRPRAAARAMRGSSYTLGVEIPTIPNHFFSKIIDGATTALVDTRYQLIIAPADPNHDEGPQAIEALADRQVDGIVAISSKVPQEWLEKLATRVPLVMIGRHHQSVHYDTLVGDDIVGAGLAVQHLFDLGHRRIVHLTLDEGTVAPGTPHAMREIGYLLSMTGLGLPPEIVKVKPHPGATLEAARGLLSHLDGPVGIFAGHDELALEVLQAVAERGLTAAQASVVGYDDTDVAAHALMSLTSINQSGTQMGAIAVRLLLERINGRTESVHEVLTPKVMARRSSTAPHS